MAHWSRVQAKTHVTLIYDGEALFTDDWKPVSKVISDAILAVDKSKVIELTINFESSGCRVAASMFGGPDHLGWPEEIEDERTLVSVEVELPNHKKVELPQPAAEAIFSLFNDAVESAELPEEEPEPDREED